MEESFDYSKIPANFAYCIQPTCPLADSCMRHLAMQNLSNTQHDFTALNPVLTNMLGNCKEYVNNTPVRVAYGTSNLYNNLTTKQTAVIRYELKGHFGKTLYYRFWRGERMISPEVQNYIREVFKRAGVESEPQYDRYDDTVLCE